MLVAVAGGLQKGVLAQIVPVLCPGAGGEQRQAGVSQQEGCFPSVGEDWWEERDKSCAWEVVLRREGRGLSWLLYAHPSSAGELVWWQGVVCVSWHQYKRAPGEGHVGYGVMFPLCG